ncbi:DNA polymerase III polC-type [Bacteroidales bacterium Barb6]|nr:DNA polymerase III polC-type [Bacteroidales bacterium Barb6]
MHYRTTAEMLDEFAFLKDQDYINEIVIQNTYAFTDAIANDIKPLKHGLHTPNIPEVDEKLTKLVYAEAHKIYGDVLPAKIEERLVRELRSITGNKYSVIY